MDVQATRLGKAQKNSHPATLIDEADNSEQEVYHSSSRMKAIASLTTGKGTDLKTDDGYSKEQQQHTSPSGRQHQPGHHPVCCGSCWNARHALSQT